MRSRFSQSRADAFAARLDLGLDAGVCLACLGIVCMAMDGGDPAEIRRALRVMSPDIWMDGLAEPAVDAVRAAHDRGDPDAQAALEELEHRGGRGTVAHAIVRHLAEKLRRRVRGELRVEELARSAAVAVASGVELRTGRLQDKRAAAPTAPNSPIRDRK